LRDTNLVISSTLNLNCQAAYILISDLGVITFSLVAKETTSLNKESAKCKDTKSSDLDFIQCSQKKVWSMMQSTVNCTIAGLYVGEPSNWIFYITKSFLGGLALAIDHN
jgi:hypothetical protein